MSAPAREGYLPISGARLYVREVGRGAPLVVLHGGPDFNHRYLLPELDELARDFRLVYYDQRGRGKSSNGVAPEDVSIDSEIDDLDQVRRRLGLDSIAVLGHSWGCVLALEYATRLPHRVSQLILLNTAPVSREDSVALVRHRVRNEAAQLAAMRDAAMTEEFAAGDIEADARYYRAHFGAAVRRPEQLEPLVSRLRADFTPDDILKAREIETRLYAQTWQVPGYDLVPGLSRLDAPALVVHGEFDFIPVEFAERVAAAMPNARLEVLPECGHFSYLEQPVAVHDAVRTFMDGGGTR
ncbi:MAG TPA: alpha/beta fold hydrolase [Candidatus Krumholzibacteria bacterium]